MKIKAIDLAVPIVGAAACLVMYAELPLWALFIGWAWYYALGAEPGAFKTALPSALAGGSMGVLCFLVVGHISPPLSPIPATMVALFITLLILMMILKIPAFSASLPAYNAYSCFIIGYGAQAYLVIEGLLSLFNAFVWIIGANFLGLAFGWLSIELERIFKKTIFSE